MPHFAHEPLASRRLSFSMFLGAVLGCVVVVPGGHSMATVAKADDSENAKQPADGATRVLSVVDLQCEYRENPLAIDTRKPRLSWRLESSVRGQDQVAYRILVASSAEKLRRNEGDLWDTGRVNSGETLHIEYDGKPLRSGERCFWKVRAWPTRGADGPSPWSRPAWWEMALLDADDWKAEWINDGRANPKSDADFFKPDPAPLFRKEFSLEKPIRRARLHVTGLGYYMARINGRRVGDHHLDPGWTDYSKRVYYSTHDVTPLLSGQDRHCLALSVGNGWYNPLPLRMWGRRNIREPLPTGRPRVIAQLEVEFDDGTRATIGTDPSWRVAPGPILRNSIYLGEVYDARRELVGWDRPGFDASQWARAAPAEEPLGPLQAQPLEPIRATRTIHPIRITEAEPGVFIYDMGQNCAGRIRMTLDVPAGTTVDLRYGELLHADGSLNPRTSACGQIKGKAKFDASGRELGVWDSVYPSSAWQGDRYIAKGVPGETYENQFTFHAFRYVEVTGHPGKPSLDMLECERLNSDVRQVGHFACSNPLLNQIQKICQWTFLSNIFSVQSDCPHRERFGYGGDLVVSCDAFLLNYDMANFYAKTVRDWHDAARGDGMLTDTAPFVGIQYCGVGWAMIHPLLQERLYRYHGNRRLIEQQYATSRRWLDLVAKSNPDHIVSRGLSDHEGMEPRPAPPMVTPLYRWSASLVSELADILDKPEEARRHAALSEQIREAWTKRFVEPETGGISPDTQGAHAFALYLDMLPEELRAAASERLARKVGIERNGHLYTGIFGTKFALDVLSRGGYAQLAYDVVDSRDFPGWGHMIASGATTLWEHWAMSDNTYSHNHPMFGSVSQWFFNWLGGIQVAPDAVGCDRMTLRPQFVDDLQWVDCRYDSIRGPVVCNWKRKDGKLELQIAVPPTASAVLYLPDEMASGAREGRQPLAEVEGISRLKPQSTSGGGDAAGGGVRYRLQSGEYQLTIE